MEFLRINMDVILRIEHGCDFYEMVHVKAARSNVGLPTRG